MPSSIRTLEPQPLWNHFADLNAVPRASKKEERVIELRKVISQRTTKVLIEGEAAAYPSEMCCAKCGERSENKGLKAIQIRSKVGALEVERTYWYCRKCREGFFPPG